MPTGGMPTAYASIRIYLLWPVQCTVHTVPKAILVSAIKNELGTVGANYTVYCTLYSMSGCCARYSKCKEKSDMLYIKPAPVLTVSLSLSVSLLSISLCLTLSHLEVQVCHVVCVKVLDPQQDLLDEVARLLLGQPFTLRNEVEQLAAPQPTVVKEYIVAKNMADGCQRVHCSKDHG